MPAASVTAVPGDTVALPDVTVNVTVTPDTGASDALVTANTSGEESVVPTEPIWPLPLTAAIAAGVAEDGLVESLQAVATSAISVDHMVLPRAATIRENITVSCISVL